jgi:type I restriction enzyme S subunit
MELKPGDRPTELGAIPDDWKVMALGAIGEVCMCKRVLKHQTKEHGDVPFYKIGTFGGHPDAFICRSLFEDLSQRYSFPKTGDVLISAAGTIGRAVVYDGEPAYFQDSNIVWIANDESRVTNRFLWHQYRVTKWAVEHGGTVARLYNENLRTKVVVAVPPMVEQSAIVSALDDADALLDGLDRLIAKKRDVKQATMQQLLTGKTRLPGFSGEWDKKRLGDVVQIRKGELITSATLIPGDVPVVAGGRQPAYFHAFANRHSRTITISASGASAGFVARYDCPIFASDCSTISEEGEYCLDFIYYLLVSHQNKIYECQSGGAQPHVHAKDLVPMVCMFPTRGEQTAIAAVLHDMDAELEALEARRDKVQSLKHAMMQELLTGKTRLVAPEAAHA